MLTVAQGFSSAKLLTKMIFFAVDGIDYKSIKKASNKSNKYICLLAVDGIDYKSIKKGPSEEIF